MITLYWTPRTRAVRVHWMLEELGLDYELRRVDLDDPRSKADPGFLMASPMGKVPAIADAEARMCDSAAICLYLSDRYQDHARLAPPVDSPMRGRFLYWMFFTPSVLEPAMAEHFGEWEPKPQQHGWGDFPTMVKTLQAGLAHGPWLMGTDFSAADVMVGSSAHFLKTFGAVTDNAAIDAYVERCMERPAYQKAMAAE